MEMLSSSQLAFRLSYNSNVLSAGRTLGIENFGLSPGVSYYHHTGLYADLSGFWSKDFDPKYYLTIASVGYMRDFNSWFSLMAGFDRYFYNIPDGDSYIPYRNSVSLTPVFDLKPLSASLAYSFYFGDQYAHRLMPGLSLALEKRKILNIDRIAVMPSVFLLLGNELISEIDFVAPQTLREAVENFRKYGTRYSVVQTNKNVFGIMNYAISIPISVSHRNWAFSFTCTYNIPKALPGEPLTLSESTYLSGSLIYLISFKRNKNPL
jgi:hypothetical protein